MPHCEAQNGAPPSRHRTLLRATGGSVSASETGFSPSSPPDTGRRCPWPSGEPPKFNHTNQHTQRLASFRVVAG